MLALARIGVLVKMRAVELGEAVRVIWEMRGSPVQENSDSRLVKPVHEVHKILRRAVTAGRREITDRLIAPGAVERVLHHRHQLDVRVAHFFYVGNQPVGKLGIREPARSFLHHPAPGTQVDLVN